MSLICENGIDFSRAGVLPIMPASMAKEISLKVNELLKENRFNPSSFEGMNEIFTIFSQDLSQPEELWKNNINLEEIEELKEFNKSTLIGERLEKALLMDFKKYHLFEELSNNINKKYPISEINKSEQWEAIIGIEHAKMERDDRKQNFYNFFGGRVAHWDKKLKNTAIRECREEGLIKFDKRIFSINYQSYIRQKYNMIHLPLKDEPCASVKNRKYHRTYILLMEDIEFVERKDYKGKYLYVRLKHDPSLHYFVRENEKAYTKAGIIPFLPIEEARKLAKALDSLASVNISNLILDIKSGKVNRYSFEEEDENQCETAAVFSRSIFSDDEKLKMAVSHEQLERLNRLTAVDLDEENQLYAKAISRNGTLYHACQACKEEINNFKYLIGKWDNILIVEPIRQKSIERYKKNCYSYLVGNIEEGETSTFQAATREALEEGRVVFDEKIYNREYQLKLRREHKINAPLHLDIEYKGPHITPGAEKKFTKSFLVFMEEINISFELDSNNRPYCFVSIK